MKSKKIQKMDRLDLVKIENFLDYESKVETKDKTFEKLMFIYSMAIRELETKIEIIKWAYHFFAAHSAASIQQSPSNKQGNINIFFKLSMIIIS